MLCFASLLFETNIFWRAYSGCGGGLAPLRARTPYLRVKPPTPKGQSPLAPKWVLDMKGGVEKRTYATFPSVPSEIGRKSVTSPAPIRPPKSRGTVPLKAGY